MQILQNREICPLKRPLNTNFVVKTTARLPFLPVYMIPALIDCGCVSNRCQMNALYVWKQPIYTFWTVFVCFLCYLCVLVLHFAHEDSKMISLDWLGLCFLCFHSPLSLSLCH